MMKSALFSTALLLLSGSISLLCAQSAPVPAPSPAPASAAAPPHAEPEIVVRRAIPVGDSFEVKPDSLPRTVPADAKLVYSQCAVESKVIAITFDDGPDPKGTPRLLDMLKERGIKATFFLVGKNAAEWPDIVKRMIEEGHEVGNHTWNHYQLTRLKDTKVASELQTTHDAIVKACGVVPVLYRPPYGATRLTQQKSIHEQFQYTCILWDVDPNDWRTPRSSARTHDRILAQTKPGSIILCHDIHHETVDAMPATLDDLKARGFQFVTVTQLLNLDSQTAASRAAAIAAARAQSEAAAAAAAQSVSPVAPQPLPLAPPGSKTGEPLPRAPHEALPAQLLTPQPAAASSPAATARSAH